MIRSTSTPSLPPIPRSRRASRINFNCSYSLLRWRAGCTARVNSHLGQEHSALTPARTPTGLCFSKFLGYYSAPKPLLVFASAWSFTQHRHSLSNWKKTKQLVWNVAVLQPRQILSQALYSSKGIASKAPIFEPLRPTNIHLITAVAHCVDITHLHIRVCAPWLASACQDDICKIFYQETKDRPCT